MPLWHPLLAATPSGGPSLIRRPFSMNSRNNPTMMQIVSGIWNSLSSSLLLPINGQLVDINDVTSANSPVRIINLSFMKLIKLDVADNTYNLDVDFVIIKNGQLLKTLFTISAGAAGNGQYSSINFIPMQNDDTFSYGFISSSNPTGGIVMTCNTEIQYGQGAITDIRGDEKEMVISNPNVSIGGITNKPQDRLCPMLTFRSNIASGNTNEQKPYTFYKDAFLDRWFFQQTRETGSLVNMTIRFRINNTVRFSLVVADNDFSLRTTLLTEETFPGSGVFVPIKVEEDDTVQYSIDSWAGETTNPIREFNTYFTFNQL